MNEYEKWMEGLMMRTSSLTLNFVKPFMLRYACFAASKFILSEEQQKILFQGIVINEVIYVL